MIAIALAVIALAFAGCDNNSSKPILHLGGMTQMYSLADHPRIAVMQEVSKGVVVTVTSAAITPPASGGWQDVPFSVALPSNPSSSGVYFLRMFNDTDGDKKWAPSNESDYNNGPGLSYDGKVWHYRNADDTINPGDATLMDYYFASANGEAVVR
jgi:hypothetical protein